MYIQLRKKEIYGQAAPFRRVLRGPWRPPLIKLRGRGGKMGRETAFGMIIPTTGARKT